MLNKLNGTEKEFLLQVVVVSPWCALGDLGFLSEIKAKHWAQGRFGAG